ncbi:MAG: hypothetical protein FJ190_02475 [Gammaproteobacteria bacterium]|nr:hypothetical protein [Gammaproteobacteria bacterium]
MSFPRYAAPSTGGFVGNSPKGCGRDAAICQKDKDVLSGLCLVGTNLDKIDGAQDEAASGGFLLDTFLCPRKEKYHACRCGNRH